MVIRRDVQSCYSQVFSRIGAVLPLSITIEYNQILLIVIQVSTFCDL